MGNSNRQPSTGWQIAARLHSRRVKEARLPRSRAQTVAAVVAVAAFYSEAATYAFWRLGSLSPGIVIAVFSAPVAFFALVSPRIAIGMLRNRLTLWVMAFVVVSAAWALREIAEKPVQDELLTRLRSAAFIVACLAAFGTPQAARSGRRAVALAVLVGVGMNVFELFAPYTFNQVSSRSAGLYLNPNRAGQALALGFAISLQVVPQRWRTLFFLSTLVGVATTFSRSSFLVLATSAFMLRDELGWRRRGPLALAAILVAVAAGGWLAVGYLDQRSILKEATRARLTFDTSDASASGRLAVAGHAVERYLEAPILGHGTASTRSWEWDISTHNTYLYLAVDHGVFGVALAVLLLVILARRRGTPRGVAAAVAVTAMFTHNLLSSPSLLLVLALAGALAAAPEPAALEGVGVPGGRPPTPAP